MATVFTVACAGGSTTPTPAAPAASALNPSISVNVAADAVTRKIVTLSLDDATLMGTTPVNGLVGYSTRLAEGSHHMTLETGCCGGHYDIALYGGLPANTGGVKPGSIALTFNDESTAGDTQVTVLPCLVRVDYKTSAFIKISFAVIRADYLQVCSS
jgi:hypothetical protein